MYGVSVRTYSTVFQNPARAKILALVRIGDRIREVRTSIRASWTNTCGPEAPPTNQVDALLSIQE